MSYKVVVVDDKPLIRRSLIETVQWEKLDCQVVGEAENGVEAKEVIRRTSPDLIITDIKMPGMDGLKLTEFVKQILPETKIIVITGYQEFEYAKKALSLGVHNMVLKPIDNKILEGIILEALERLKEQRLQANALRDSMQARRSNYLAEIIGGRRGMDEIEQKEVELLGFDKKYISIIYIQMKSREQKEREIIRKRITELMERYEKAGRFEVLELAAVQELVLAVLQSAEESARERKIRLKNCLWEANQRIREEFQASCFFVISRGTKNIADLEICAREAKELFESRYFLSDSDILFMESYTFKTDVQNSSYILKELDCFYRELEQMDESTMQERVGNMMAQICLEMKGDAFRIKCLMSELCITLLRHYCAEIPQEKITDDTNEILEKIHSLPDIRSSREYLTNFIREMQQYARQKQGDVNPVVAGALAHIRENYRDELSLTDVAEAMGVNASYLSRLLKKETGRNFSDILTECRLTAAKRLLDKPESRVIDVCEMVGYRDYTYFYQVFKRVEGISPSEYKKRGKKI